MCCGGASPFTVDICRQLPIPEIPLSFRSPTIKKTGCPSVEVGRSDAPSSIQAVAQPPTVKRQPVFFRLQAIQGRYYSEHYNRIGIQFAELLVFRCRQEVGGIVHANGRDLQKALAEKTGCPLVSGLLNNSRHKFMANITDGE
jgi:hypothetical protein